MCLKQEMINLLQSFLEALLFSRYSVNYLPRGNYPVRNRPKVVKAFTKRTPGQRGLTVKWQKNWLVDFAWPASGPK